MSYRNLRDGGGMRFGQLSILTLLIISVLAGGLGAYQRTVLVENFTNWG